MFALMFELLDTKESFWESRLFFDCFASLTPTYREKGRPQFTHLKTHVKLLAANLKQISRLHIANNFIFSLP